MVKMLDKYKVVLICVLLAVVTIAAYRQILLSEFTNFDDPMYVSENNHVKGGLTWKNVGWAFTSYDVAYWHPLTWLSHMVDCELYGLRAELHHLTSLILHIANSLLLFLVFRRMTGAVWRSAFVAAVFAVHPLNVDSAAWIAERKNVLSTLFWLLTMWFYAGYANRGGTVRYLAALLLYALGLLAKPMLVTLPFVMLLLDYWPLRRFRLGQDDGQSDTPALSAAVVIRLVREKIPFFVLSVSGVLSFCLAVERPGTAVSTEVVPVGLRIANALVSYVSYASKTIWPCGLAVYYPYPEAIPIWKAAGVLLLVAGVSVLVVGALRKRPYAAVGWFWYVGTLVPVIGLYQAGLWPAMADRWAYVPLIGLLIIIAWGVGDLAGRWNLPGAVVIVGAGTCLAALTVCTWVQVGYWRDGYTLFTHALEVTRDNYIAHYNLANVLLKRGEADKAVEHYKEAIGIHETYVDAYYNLGIALAAEKRYGEAIVQYRTVLKLTKKEDYKKILFRMAEALARSEQPDEALSYYDKALKYKPDDTEILNNYGLALVGKGKIDEAVTLYDRSLEIDPDSVELLNNLANALVKQKKFSQALVHFEKALSINPGFVETHYNLAGALRQMGEIDRAVFHYHEVLRLKPDDIDAIYGLGLALAAGQKYDEAIAYYEKAIQVDGNFSLAYYQLGMAYFHKKQTGKAIEQFRQVLRIHPKDAEMHCNLGVLLAQEGRLDEAIEEFRTALELKGDFPRARQQLEAALRRKAVPNTR
jgi:tetratricopeptide (TPR) repeat protein